MKKDTSQSEAATPAASSVRNYIIYGLSLPERTLRSTAAMVGGVVHESATLLVPQAFRDSTSYQTFVQQMLDMMVKDMGGVNSPTDDSNEADVESYVARKTVGSFIDLAGMATLHLSPIVLLAVVSDVAYGSTTYLKELGEQLKQEGVIADDSTIESAADLLEAIGEFSSETATVFDTPPINVEGLRSTIEETTDNIARIDPTQLLPKSEIDKFWSDMKTIAIQENVGIVQLSSAMTMYTLNQVETVSQGALTTITVAGNLLDKHVLQHYWDGMEQISERGLYTIVSESSQPYFAAVWENFSSERETITQDLVSGKLVGQVWDGVREWFAPAKSEAAEISDE